MRYEKLMNPLARLSRRMRAAALAIILCAGIGAVLFCPAARAAVHTFTIDELGLALTAPEGFAVFTRETRADDPVLAEMGISYEQLIQNFAYNGVYFNATRTTPYAEINVAMRKSEQTEAAKDYAQMTSEQLELIAMQAAALGADGIYSFTGYSLYESGGEKYIVLDLIGVIGEEEICGLQYRTMRGGQYLTFTLVTYGTALEYDDEALLERMIQGCVYTAEEAARPLWMYLLPAFGMMLAGGLTLISARRRIRRAEQERIEKRRALRRAGRPSYCPSCGSPVEESKCICTGCGRYCGM